MKGVDQATVAVTEDERGVELSVYEKLITGVRANLDKLGSSVDPQVLTGAIEKAANEMKAVGEHSRETISHVSEALKKDLATSAGAVKHLVDTLGDGAEHAVDKVQDAGGAVWDRLATGTGGTVVTWRDKGGGALAALLGDVSGWSGKLGLQLKQALTYRTGEMTYGGGFRCASCDTRMKLKKPGHLPPCPKCHKTAFLRS